MFNPIKSCLNQTYNGIEIYIMLNHLLIYHRLNQAYNGIEIHTSTIGDIQSQCLNQTYNGIEMSITTSPLEANQV